MASAFTKLGANRALQTLGLAPTPPEPAQDHTLRNVAMSGAAASPFLGLIGSKRQIHSPDVTPMKRLSLEEIQGMARPGDVVVSGRPNWRNILTGTMTPHAEVVLGRRGKQAIGVTPGEWVPEQLRRAGAANPAEAETYARMAADLEHDPKVIQKWQKALGERLRDLGQERVILLRPEQKLQSSQLKALRDVGYREAAKPWSFERALSSLARDWFVPKTRLFARGPELCSGNICTTQTAKTLEAGGVSDLAAGKKAKDIVATDLLSSDKLRALGAYEQAGLKSRALSPAVQRLAHYGLRGGLGLGLAGGVYAMTEDPRYAAIPLAGYGAAAGARKLFGHQSFRPLKEIFLSPKAKRIPRAVNVGTRTIPLMLAAGLGTYFGTRALSRKKG